MTRVGLQLAEIGEAFVFEEKTQDARPLRTGFTQHGTGGGLPQEPKSLFRRHL